MFHSFYVFDTLNQQLIKLLLMDNIKFFLKKIIVLKRVKLTKLSIKHLNDIHEYSQNNIFFKYLEYNSFKNKAKTRNYLNKRIKENNFKNTFWWSIMHNGKIIGTVRLHNVNTFRKTCEIGYGINPDFWGKGFFKEIINGLMKICIKKNRFHRCQAITAKNNIASIMGLIKCGFKKEGVLVNYYFDKDNKKNFDAVLLSKTITN